MDVEDGPLIVFGLGAVRAELSELSGATDLKRAMSRVDWFPRAALGKSICTFVPLLVDFLAKHEAF